MALQDRQSVGKIIAGLALLTANLERHRDYLDIFLPLIAQTLLQMKPKIISTEELQEKVDTEFGIKIPQNAMKLILNRAQKRGYIHKQDGAYVPIYSSLSRLNFDDRRKDVQRQQNAAVQKLLDFTDKQYNIKLGKSDAESALLDFIRQNDIDLLHCSIGNTPPKVLQIQLDKKISYIVKSFVIHTFENDPEGFRYIDTIIKGMFLSHYLMFPDLEKVQKRFIRTEIFFDTAFILRALGYEGSRYIAPSKELLDLLFEEGAMVKCFRDTRNEVYNVLYACMLAIKRGSLEEGGPTYHFFSDNGYTASEIELELSILDSNIAGLGMKIIDKPINKARYQIDEEKLEEYLKNEASYWRENDRQRVHDATSLAAVYGIRQGHDYTHIEDSKALFITPNPRLCRVGLGFFTKEGYVGAGSVPIAMTDYALTSIIWIKKPIKPPNLPQQYFVAQCYAAIEPDARLWKTYAYVVSKLKDKKTITSDEYYLLRYSQVAHTEMMDMTFGDEEAMTEGTALEILEKVKDGIRKESTSLLVEERLRHQGQEEEILKQIADLTRQKEEALKTSRMDKERHDRRIQQLERNSEQKARRIARFLSWGICGLIIATIAGGAIYSFVNFVGGILRVILLGGAIALAALGVWNLIYGVTIIDLRNRLEANIAKRLQNIFKKWFLPLDGIL